LRYTSARAGTTVQRKIAVNSENDFANFLQSKVSVVSLFNFIGVLLSSTYQFSFEFVLFGIVMNFMISNSASGIEQ
jgi:hypothetical protein